MFSQKEFVVMDENDNVGIVKQRVSKGQKIGPIAEGGEEVISKKGQKNEQSILGLSAAGWNRGRPE